MIECRVEVLLKQLKESQEEMQKWKAKYEEEAGEDEDETESSLLGSEKGAMSTDAAAAAAAAAATRAGGAIAKKKNVSVSFGTTSSSDEKTRRHREASKVPTMAPPPANAWGKGSSSSWGMPLDDAAKTRRREEDLPKNRGKSKDPWAEDEKVNRREGRHRSLPRDADIDFEWDDEMLGRRSYDEEYRHDHRDRRENIGSRLQKAASCGNLAEGGGAGWSDTDQFASQMAAANGAWNTVNSTNQFNHSPGPNWHGGDPNLHQRPAGRRERVAAITQATKVIRSKLIFTRDILNFLTTLNMIKRQINRFFRDESEEFKINCLIESSDERTRVVCERIYDDCEVSGQFNFDEFSNRIFESLFPASKGTLRNCFMKITQSYPSRLTISEYAERFRSLSSMLGWAIEGFFIKWIDGLQSFEVRKALKNSRLDNINFSELVEFAISIETNLYASRENNRENNRETRSRLLLAEGEEEETDEEETVLKIFEIAVSKYLTTAKERKVEGRCFNCFSLLHKSIECRQKSCRFCDKLNSECRHLSLCCPKCPLDLSKFIEVRNLKKTQKSSKNVRFAADFENYEFDSDELSSE